MNRWRKNFDMLLNDKKMKDRFVIMNEETNRIIETGNATEPPQQEKG